MKFRAEVIETTVTKFEYEVAKESVKDNYDIDPETPELSITQRIIDVDTEYLQDFTLDPEDFTMNPKVKDKRQVKIERVK